MPRFTCDDVQRITSGRWLREGRGDAPQAVSTDTRQLGGGELFIALRGERFDAHDYLAEAVRRGAGALVVDDADKAAAADTGKVPMLLVDDAVAALQALARAWRDALGAAGVRVISVSGSNGKTTTRHLVHAVLSAQLVGSQSPKSFNNHLGVPLTLLGARAQDDFVVVEIGTNHMGEVAQLGAIVRPDIAVITSIGREHMEHFQTLANVAAEEAAILAHVAADGVIIAPGDEPQLADHLAGAAGRVVRFGGTDDCELRVSGIAADGDGVRFDVNGAAHRVALPGEHNARNAAAALAVAKAMNVDERLAAAALATATGPPMRLAVQRVGRGVIINDAYNANPESMAAALRTLAAWPGDAGRSRVAIIGDMLELGDDSPSLHREVGDFIAQLDGIDRVFTVGRYAMFTAAALARHWPGGERVTAYAAWQDDLPGVIAAQLRGDEVVLVKASRGMALERLLPSIIECMSRKDAPA